MTYFLSQPKMRKGTPSESREETSRDYHGLPRYKALIIDCLSMDFQFSQFLLGENTVANLVDVKERLSLWLGDGLRRPTF